ncbi:MAG: hypothetical protein WCC06_13600 [Candidatus Aminicenantales bacterium]
MAKATIEDLAFPRRFWRAPGLAGRRGCLSFSRKREMQWKKWGLSPIF